MLYAILCYHDEDTVGSWTREQDAAVMKKLAVVQDKLTKQGRLGPVARLLPTTSATTLRKDDPPVVLDGPYAETKEQLLGFYVVDCRESRRGARCRARSRCRQSRRRLRNSPGRHVPARGRSEMTDTAWIDCRADFGASPGGRRAVTLFPQSRHRRGSISERLPARAEKLAAERSAARSGGVADHGRAQCRDRRYQAKPQAGAAARGRGDLRSRRCRGGAGRAARRLALSRRHLAAVVHLLPSRSAGDAADRAGAAHRLRPDGEADRARVPGLRGRDGAAHHPREGTRRGCRRAVRDAGRGGAHRAARLRSPP